MEDKDLDFYMQSLGYELKLEKSVQRHTGPLKKISKLKAFVSVIDSAQDLAALSEAESSFVHIKKTF